MTAITFIIPVRHQDNAKDWALLKANLAQTLASVAAQDHDDWRGIVVANEGADLPPLPDRFSAVRVTFPPNDLHELGKADREAVLDAFRFDKGRRVLAGMLAARDSRFFMIVDDDDFVSRRIAGHCAANPDANGWTVDRGYIWADGGSLLYAHDAFGNLCGTSLIVPAERYALPAAFEDASIDWIKDMLGSHQRIKPILADRGAPLAPLPFRGAVYRVGHAGAHSRSQGLLSTYIFKRALMKRPWRALRNLTRLRPIGAQARREFFGGA